MLARVRQLALQRLTLISHSNIRFAATVPSTNVPVNVRKEDLVDADKSEFLQPVSMEDLPRAQKRYAKQFEQINMVRTKEIFRKNYRVRQPFRQIAQPSLSIKLLNSEHRHFMCSSFGCHLHLCLHVSCSQAGDFSGRDRSGDARGSSAKK